MNIGLSYEHRLINKWMLALGKPVWRENTRLTSPEVRLFGDFTSLTRFRPSLLISFTQEDKRRHCSQGASERERWGKPVFAGYSWNCASHLASFLWSGGSYLPEGSAIFVKAVCLSVTVWRIWCKHLPLSSKCTQMKLKCYPVRNNGNGRTMSVLYFPVGLVFGRYRFSHWLWLQSCARNWVEISLKTIYLYYFLLFSGKKRRGGSVGTKERLWITFG